MINAAGVRVAAREESQLNVERFERASACLVELVLLVQHSG